MSGAVEEEAVAADTPGEKGALVEEGASEEGEKGEGGSGGEVEEVGGAKALVGGRAGGAKLSGGGGGEAVVAFDGAGTFIVRRDLPIDVQPCSDALSTADVTFLVVLKKERFVHKSSFGREVDQQLGLVPRRC